MKRVAFITAGVLAAGLALAGCSPSADTSASTDTGAGSSASADPNPASSAQALPPTIVSPGDLDGRDVSVIVGTALVLAVAEGTEAEWQGSTADRSIAEFSAGGASEGATFRPGFEARATGTTDATVTGPDGAPIDFRISVVAP